MTPAHYAGLSRIIITPLTLLLLLDWEYSRVVVIATVIVAIISDILDGYLARKYNTVSTFGIYLDVTADKVYLCSLLIVMSVVGLVPTWMTITIVIREYIVMGIRSYAAAEGFVLSAQFWGKLKTIALFPGVLLVLLNIPYSVYVIALAVIMAAVSGIDYALKVSRYISGRSMSPESS